MQNEKIAMTKNGKLLIYRTIGVLEGNSEDMSDYADNKHRVFIGRLLAYIQAKGNEGKINVRFTSPWLKSTELTIEVK